MGAGKVSTLTGLWHGYMADTKQSVSYKSYHDRLAQPAFPELMRGIVEHMTKRLRIQSLKFPPGSPFARFEDIILQDGTAYGLNDRLAKDFPGIGSVAGVEIHTGMSLLFEAPKKVAISGHSASERDYLPKPSELRNCLLLADRGYFSFAYPAKVAEEGGFYIIRARGDLCTPVLGRFIEGQFLPEPSRLPLSEYDESHQARYLDLAIRPEKGLHAPFRMVVMKTPKGLTYLMTNLPVRDFSAKSVGLAYRLRWQVELMYKEWKSHANLHRFATANPGIAEGLIWASLAASLVKRFVALTAQSAAKVAISTQKVAQILCRFLTPLLIAIVQVLPEAKELFEEALQSLATYAKRSNPRKEKRKGRAKLGLKPCFAT
jgi:IS4 transposase